MSVAWAIQLRPAWAIEQEPVKGAGEGGAFYGLQFIYINLPTFTNLKRVHYSVKEFNDKQRRDLCLDHGHKEDLVSVDTQEVVVRGGDNRRNIFGLRGPLLGLKKVVTNRATDHAFPVFLQENVSRGVDQEKTVDHGEACWWERNTFSAHKPLDRADFQL